MAILNNTVVAGDLNVTGNINKCKIPDVENVGTELLTAYNGLPLVKPSGSDYMSTVFNKLANYDSTGSNHKYAGYVVVPYSNPKLVFLWATYDSCSTYVYDLDTHITWLASSGGGFMNVTVSSFFGTGSLVPGAANGSLSTTVTYPYAHNVAISIGSSVYCNTRIHSVQSSAATTGSALYNAFLFSRNVGIANCAVASGHIYTDTNSTNIVIGVCASATTNYLGFSYVTLVSTSGTTTTIKTIPTAPSIKWIDISSYDSNSMHDVVIRTA